MRDWHALFDYRDGQLVWKTRPESDFSSPRAWAMRNARFAGKPAGSANDKGYIKVKVDGVIYSTARIIFEMHYGYSPEMIDHINGDKSDERLVNLRAATRAENAQNSKINSRNTSGVRGVTRNGNGWRVQIHKNKAVTFMRTFPDFELAELVAVEARKHYHGEFFSNRRV